MSRRMIKLESQEKQQLKEKLEKYVCDRAGWPAGEWDSEPEDRIEFIHAGYACLMLRGPVGSWCAYVGVDETHPAFGKNYDDVDVQVHGGLTYANHCNGFICHEPKPGMPEHVYWLGFDTAHCGDASPGILRFHLDFVKKNGGVDYRLDDTYRNVAYVKSEVEQLAEQLAVMAKEAA